MQKAITPLSFLYKRSIKIQRFPPFVSEFSALHYSPVEMTGLSATDSIAMSEECDTTIRGGGRRGESSTRGRGRGRGGRGGGGGGGKGEMNREVAVSKALSKLLRHAADDAGLKLDGEGFARVDQVVS